MKKFLKNWFTDNRKAGLMRWWLVGMCYFMIGFGTQVGGYSSPIDFIFFLGVGIGLVTIVVYNPIAYNVFRLTPEWRDFKPTPIATFLVQKKQLGIWWK